jgi:hypothetical protein
LALSASINWRRLTWGNSIGGIHWPLTLLETAIDLPSFSLADNKKPALAGPAVKSNGFNLGKFG